MIISGCLQARHLSFPPSRIEEGCMTADAATNKKRRCQMGFMPSIGARAGRNSTKPQLRARRFTVALAALSAVMGASPAWAVEDTDTPGNGNWEINLEANGARSASGWEVEAPAIDVNYGWGDRVQLMAGVPWVSIRETGRDAKSGLGAGTIGAKWRFVDQEKQGIAVSTFPQYSWNLVPSSLQRGIVSDTRQLLVPVQFGGEYSEYGIYGELARNFVESGQHETLAGVKITHSCTARAVCRIELQRSKSAAGGQTLAFLGTKIRLTDSIFLKAGAGRDIGPYTPDRRNLILRFGLQFLR
jgi:hypothetical protein